LGLDKARLRLRGEPLLLHLVRFLGERFPEVLVAVGRRRPFGFLVEAPLVEDLIPGQGPLSGLHAGLSAASHPTCLVTACDMPFLFPELIGFLLRAARGGRAVVCQVRGYLEPFPGLYPKGIVPQVEAALRQGNPSVQALLRGIPRLVLPEDAVRSVDPKLHSFVNLNTLEDLRRWLK